MTKDEIMRKTFEELGRRYPSGLYEFLYKGRKDVYQYLINLEDDIDKAFLFGTEEQLRSTLKEYWTLHMKAIQIFKNRDTTDFDTKEIRQQMLEDRVRT